MWQYFIKIILTSILIVTISEVAKRWTFFGSLLAALPLTSILVMIWIYIDTSNIDKVVELSQSIFWMTIPSLSFFVFFYILINKFGWGFVYSLGLSMFSTAGVYWVYLKAISRFGIKI